MTTATQAPKTANAPYRSFLDDLVERLGGIPLSRFWLEPAPGTATEADVLEAERRLQPALRTGRRSLGGESDGVSRIAVGGRIDRDS